MLYTLGEKSVYEAYMKSDPNASKGVGGSVWKDEASVKAYMDGNPEQVVAGFAIYGVEADWILDTAPGHTMHVDTERPKTPWRSLTRSAKLVRL